MGEGTSREKAQNPPIYALLPTSAVGNVSYSVRLEITASKSEFEIAQFRSKTLCRLFVWLGEMSPLWQLLDHTASLNSFSVTLSPKNFLFCLSLNEFNPLGFPEIAQGSDLPVAHLC